MSRTPGLSPNPDPGALARDCCAVPYDEDRGATQPGGGVLPSNAGRRGRSGNGVEITCCGETIVRPPRKA